MHKSTQCLPMWHPRVHELHVEFALRRFTVVCVHDECSVHSGDRQRYCWAQAGHIPFTNKSLGTSCMGSAFIIQEGRDDSPAVLT